MNPKINPCDDFYEFACGKFIEDTVIPEDQSSVSPASVIGDDLELKLKTIIEGIDTGDAHKYSKLTKELYESCSNHEAIEAAGLAEIKSIITALGRWPVLDGTGWTGTVALDSMVKELRSRGYSTSYIIAFGVGAKWTDTSKYIIQLNQPTLVIDREILLLPDNHPIVKAYRDFMTDVATIFGATGSHIKDDLDNILKFEKDLAKISVPRQELSDFTKLNNIYTLGKIESDYSGITNWKEYIKNALGVTGITIDNTEEINVSVPKYFEELTKFTDLQQHRVVQNYIIFRVIVESLQFLNKDLRSAMMKMQYPMTGVAEFPKRWKECVSVTTNALPIAIGSLYVRKHFNPEARTSSIVMVEDIKNQFKDIVRAVDWMDEDTRKKALEKVEVMAEHIAYPEELADDKKVNEYYNELNFAADFSFLKMMLQRNKFITDQANKKLRDDIDKEDWTGHGNAATINAFYNFLQNSIEFPAAILQGAYFDQDRPRYINYGAIGFVIGHEITHGFDDKGKQFNKDGNLEDWWKPATAAAYIEKAKCIEKQYSKYEVEEINEYVNGKLTLGENIADNGGVKEAYLAYKASVDRMGKEPRLPGLSQYTPEQMFWISSANIWCWKHTKSALSQLLKTDVHAPPRFRIIGSLSNNEHFARDFNCPVGSKMNPPKEAKCIVW